MRQTVRHQLWITGVAVVALFANLGATRLWDQDEAFFARTAVEMHQRNEWVVPYFNGELFAHKPPLMYWMMRLGFMLFGVNEFAARFWSAVFGVLTALLVYRLGRRMFNAQVGLWAGLAMTTTLMFEIVARAATPDCFLVFFATLALYVFVRQENWEDVAGGTVANDNLTPLPWRMCATMYAVMGLAVLVKGPIGMLLPGATVGLYLLMRDPTDRSSSGKTWTATVLLFLQRLAPGRILRVVWSMRPFTALAAVTVVAGPWFGLVGWRTGGDFLREFIGTQNYGRFVGAMDNHSGGAWYYVAAILIGFFPWSVFGIPTVVDLTRRCCGVDSWQRGGKLLVCWIMVYVGFFSVAATKLPNYVLPAYPALALATACFIDRWLTQPATVHRWWLRLSFGSLGLVGCVMAISMPLIAKGTIQGRSLLEQLGISAELAGDISLVGWLGIILLIGGITGIFFAEVRRGQAAMIGLATTALAFCIAMFASIAVRIDRHQPSPTVAEAIRHHSVGVPQVAQFGYFRPSLVYYMDGRVEACKTPQRLIEFLEQATDTFVVTTDEQYVRLAAQLPADVVIVAKCAEFPRLGEVLVLGRKTTVAQRDEGQTK
ncbi:MAG TPA: glycosyltransferase family 39 protein [Pirellulales bacterium]|nr:glycosyltransferase family 39 protein [Pirellulales bacterium]